MIFGMDLFKSPGNGSMTKPLIILIAGMILCLDYSVPVVLGAPPEARTLSPPGIARHYGGLNCAFVDGHVKWLQPQQAAEPGLWSRDGR